MEYQLVFASHSIKNPKEKLLNSIILITREIKEDSAFSHVNEVLLNQIVINEYSKAYLTKEVDAENKEGYYAIYKRLVGRLSEMIAEVDADYEYPTSLASTILENGLHQHYLREHFPSLTDCNERVTPTQYLTHLVFNTLKQNLNE